MVEINDLRNKESIQFYIEQTLKIKECYEQFYNGKVWKQVKSANSYKNKTTKMTQIENLNDCNTLKYIQLKHSKKR